MPVETAADRATFVSPNDFGLTATLRHAGTNVETVINGIFDTEYLAADVDQQVAVATVAPRLQCRTGDIPEELVDNLRSAELDITAAALTAAALPTKHAGTYLIRDHEPDGAGMSLLWLKFKREID